jgi:hypothetical protein
VKRLLFVVLIALIIPSAWGQIPRRSANGPYGAFNTNQHAHTLHARSLKRSARAATKKATSPAPAAGVVTVHLEPSSGAMTAYFVNTSVIPAGSTITGWLTLLDDDSFIDFDQFTLPSDMPAGSITFLPQISAFGDLWQQASFDFTVFIIDPSGNQLQADGFAEVGEPYNFSDLPFIEPVLVSTTQTVASTLDVVVKVSGYFTSDTPNVVLSDVSFIYLVPPTAVTLVSASEVDIDLSQVPGLDLTSLDDLLLSVSQAGFADTMVYRYVPGAPNTFNPAPASQIRRAQ